MDDAEKPDADRDKALTPVIPDVVSHEETQDTMALLKILTLGNREIEAGKVAPAADVIKRLREKQARR